MRRWTILSLLLLLLAPGVGRATSVSTTVQIAINAPFPLTVATGVLQNAQGQPFLIVGDSPQAAISNISLCSAGNTYALCHGSSDALPTATWVAYLRDRQAHGFNTVQFDALCDSYIQCGSNSSNGGAAPFTATIGGACGSTVPDCYNLSTPNATYFAVLDGMIELANDYGMAALLTVPETGNCAAGTWWKTFQNNTTANVQGFGTFLGNRYKSGGTVPVNNLVLQFGNDYQCWPTDSAAIENFYAAFHTADPAALITGENSYELSSTLDNTVSGINSLVNLNGIYSYYPLYDGVIHGAGQSSTVPTFVVETYYDGESATSWTGDGPSPFRDRKLEWWAMTSGASAGYIYGDTYIWPFKTGWNTASNIDTTTVTQLGYLAGFMRGIAWQNLAPDASSTLVTAGRGTYANAPISSGTPGGSANSSPNNVGGNTYVSAARSANGALAVAYLPTLTTVTVNLATMGANVTAQWFDPTTNAYTPICSGGAGSCSSASHTFNPSNQGLGTHSDGASDWVLLLTASSNVSASISANPTTIPNGGASSPLPDTLTWTSSGASSCVGNGFSTGNAVNGSTTVSPTTTTNYSVTCNGITSSNAMVTVSGALINAATSYCAANGGGNGSSGSPWQAACIQAAINAAANGDTVYLPAGNWQLQISASRVVTGNKLVNLVGAGSGNTFDAYGHPSNGAGGPVGTVTRVYGSGTSGAGGGALIYGNYDSYGSTGCSGANPGPTVSHLYVDGSLAMSSGSNGDYGDTNSTMSFQSCDNATINDVRVLQCCVGSLPSADTNFWIRDSANVAVKNSVFTMPVLNGSYSPSQALQVQEQGTLLMDNNVFYAQSFNPIYYDNITFTRNYTFFGCDTISCSSPLGQAGLTGCSYTSCWNGGNAGSHGFFVRNNYFNSISGNSIDFGGGVNDPSTAGTIADLEITGNWFSGAKVAVDSCESHLYGSCVSNVVASGTEGMQVNGLTATNNSLIGTSEAHLTATGTGCTSQGTGLSCPSSSLPNMTMVNYAASQNYLSSPSNQYDSDAYTITPSVSNNYCSGSSFSGCNTTGFTTVPTCSFAVGTLSGSTLPIASTSFTAQYGAVQYILSTSSTTPTSGDSRWNQSGNNGSGNDSYVPPVSLSPVAHLSTVYMWVMDSADHIASCGSASVP